MSLLVVVEGETDIPVCRRLVDEAGFTDPTFLKLRTKQAIDRRLREFNESAKALPWFVLRDLDSDARCAAAWLAANRFKPSRWMSLRFAVRQMEAWLLADAALADFLEVPKSRLPRNPDSIRDAKEYLVNLGRRSRSAAIRDAVVPAPRSSSKVGPAYSVAVGIFAIRHWDPARAASSSDSLRRARESLRDLGRRWRAERRN